MYQKPSVPRSIGGVLDDTLQLYKASFSKCLTPALLIGVAVTLLALYQVSRIPVTASGATNIQAILARGMANTPASFLFWMIGILIDLVFYGTMIYIIAAVSRGQAPSFGVSFAAALRRLPANIVATVLLFVITVIGFVVAFVPFIFVVASRGTGGSIQDVLTRIAPAIPVSLVLLIPLAYVLSRMSLFMVPLVAESMGPFGSIGSSWHLVGGNWWRTSTVVFVMAVIVYVLTAVVVAIAGAIAAVVVGVPTGAGQVLGAVALVGAVVGGLVRVVSAPLMSAMLVSIYQDLLLRKGGGDLEARLGALPKS
jgi:hypothetical protein